MQLSHFLITTLFRRNVAFNLNVGIYSTQGTKELTVESVIFNGFDLAASVGGYLGLFLGASIISLYHSGFALGRKVAQTHCCLRAV